MKIKRNDLVEVITGADSTPSGQKPVARRVLQVLLDKDKVVVEGVNRVYKHVRRGHPKSPQGGRLSREMPIDVSNVLYFCNPCGKGVRLGVRFADDGSKSRFCKKCGRDVGQISGPNPKYAKAARTAGG